MAGKSVVSKIIISAQDRFSKIFGKFGKSAKGMVDDAKDLGKSLAVGFGVATAAAGAVVVSLGVMIQKVFSAQDALGKTADRLGATTEGLQALHQAAELAGISTETMDMGLQRMTRRLAEAAKGGGEAKAAIEELGLNASKLAKMGPEQALQTIIRKLEGVKNESDRVRLAFKFFDSEGVKFLNLTSDALREAAEEARNLGTALDRKTIASMESINDSWTKIKLGFQGFATQVAAKVAPVLEGIAKRLENFVKQGGLADLGRRLGEGLAGVIPKLIEITKAAGVAFVQAIPRALLILLDLVGKVGLAFTGWELIWNGLKQAFYAVGIVAGEVFQGILNSLVKVAEGMSKIGLASKETVAGLKALAQINEHGVDGLDSKLQAAVRDQDKLIAEQDVHQRKIARYREEIDGMQGSFDSFAASMSNAFTTASEESVAALDRVKRKIEEVNSVSINAGGGYSNSEFAEQAEKIIRDARRTG